MNTGKLGEDIAHKYLKRLGYKILMRNFRIRGGEIDIIAIDGDTLVFVEVKTRSSDLFGSPEDAINYHKLRFIERAGKFFRFAKNNLPEAERIDVIAVDVSSSKAKIRHTKNAGF
jgi:putative endonuclease